MRKLRIVMMMFCGVGLSHADLPLGDKSTVVFANIEKGKEILLKRDEFIRNLSPFDRSARVKTDQAVSEEEFLKVIGENILDWPDDDERKVTACLRVISQKMERFSLPFPETVYMIRTTGKEEGNAAYTRADAVVLPESQLSMHPDELQKLICHELFHVLSRHNPSLRERLYDAIGFKLCQEITFPVQLAARKITNPDAPLNNCCINVRCNGKTVRAVPILFSSTEKYDMARGGDFFNYLKFQFLLPDAENGSGSKLADVSQFSDFFSQVGSNTHYIIHPEEILAENFTLLVWDKTDVPSPEILEKIKKILLSKS